MADIGERELVTIREVAELTPIPGADVIEVARVDGWEVVVKKGEFAVGDKGLFFEIDWFLPASDPRFAFLANKFTKWTDPEGNVNEGARCRSIRLRGVISQGLLLPLKDFPEALIGHSGFECKSLAEVLRVKKWERPIPACLGGIVKGGLPYGIPKTDQERIQNKRYLDKYADHTFEVSLKLDGSSMTVYYSPPFDSFGVCSRNNDLVEAAGSSFWQVARRLKLEEKMRAYAATNPDLDLIVLQGELMMGPGVQETQKLQALDMYVFDIYVTKVTKEDSNKVDSYYISPFYRTLIMEEYFEGVHHVPIVSSTYPLNPDKLDTPELRKKLLEWADNTPSLTHAVAEGLVFKVNPKEDEDRGYSFKVISNKFLLKEK